MWNCAWCYANPGGDPVVKMRMTYKGRDGTYWFCSRTCAGKAVMKEREHGGSERTENRGYRRQSS